jgi:hypothetical protein
LWVYEVLFFKLAMYSFNLQFYVLSSYIFSSRFVISNLD